MKPSTVDQVQPLEFPPVRKVDVAAPLLWLQSGWQDYRRRPLHSSLYGLIFVILGYVLTLASWNNRLLVMTFMTGFLLAAPFLCLGLYDLSRHLERDQPFHWRDTLNTLLSRRWDMALLVVFQAFVMIAWVRIATLIHAVYLTQTGSSVSGLFEQLFTTSQGLGFTALFVLSGALLAVVIFVTSVVAWPMLLDRDSGILVAVGTSLNAVKQNLPAMLVWAFLIVALIALGFATLFIGLIVILPLIGHATWHAYRGLVE